MTVKLLTEHHLEFLRLNRGCRGWSQSTLVNMPHVGNHMSLLKYVQQVTSNEYSLAIFRRLVILNLPSYVN